MSKERDRPPVQDDQLPTGEMARPTAQEVLDGQPRQVAQVNMLPDEPLAEEYEESLDVANLPVPGADTPVADSGSVEGGWGPMAWLLGLLVLAISIGGLILVLQGVFRSMPR